MTLRTEDLELGVYLLEMKLGKLKGNKQLRKLTYQNLKKNEKRRNKGTPNTAVYPV